MTRLLEENKVNKTTIAKIARIIVDFHENAKTSKRIDEFGSLHIIKKNWRENFDQTKEFINKTISQENYYSICRIIEDFINMNELFFARRVFEKKIKDCHGDIHSGNIFIADKIYIFDAIEFNERFRYSDTASEIAFLAMDLDYRNRNDLSNFFIEQYINYSQDNELNRLVDFYKCYRAYVRGKVISFKLNDPSVKKEDKEIAKRDAEAYFKLATEYAKLLIVEINLI
jgi:aminoglycoside phosphotransferase family enzyme